MEGHRTAERRSLAYHRALAERLARDPAILASARRRVAEWAATGAVAEPYVRSWTTLLDRSVEDLANALTEDSEKMTALRQVSPFAGALDPRTRWEIWRSVS